MGLGTRLAGDDGGREHSGENASGDRATVPAEERDRLLGDGVKEGERVGVHEGMKRAAGRRLTRR